MSAENSRDGQVTPALALVFFAAGKMYISFLNISTLGFSSFIDDLQRVPLKNRELIIEALLLFAKLDQKITPAEYDVIRLISYRLGIPLSLDLKLVERN